MNKYLAVFKINWENALVYRLNFSLWRVRSVLQLLLVYFIWFSVFQSQQRIFGYDQSSILTYILIAALVRAIVLSSRVMDVANVINEGSVANFFLKPISFIGYYFIRDLSDKLLNISFVIFELALILFLLKPSILIQKNLSILALFLLAVFLGLFLFFIISFIVGLMSFWVENSWGLFFLMYIFLETFGGGIFPIDILPSPYSQIFLIAPFPYLLYFPAKIYLGTLAVPELVKGFFILSFWIIVLYFLMVKLYRAGIRQYSAVGH
ncbi:ABC-2 family transporter protein [Candidatus Daviesbacteria bacterium]|nr:ABC-2 family transporter protein [Candidatus Daviesbacteria bacterium]